MEPQVSPNPTDQGLQLKQLATLLDELRQEQASLSQEIVSLKADKQAVLNDINAAKTLLAEYEKTMIETRTKDEQASQDLKNREMKLEAKQRALVIDRQTLDNEKRQFYATKEL